MAGLNALGCQYYYMSFGSSNGTTFVGSQYSNLVFPPGVQYSWPQYFSSYRQLGILFNVSAQVETYIASQMAQLNLLATRANVTLPTGANTFNTATAVPSNVPTVMFMYWGGTIGTYYGSYDNGLMELMCETCGCNYVHGTWTTESILTLNPQIIIISTGGQTPATPFSQIPAFASLQAVQNKTVYTDPNLPWTSNTGGLLVANYVAEIGGWINPSWLTAPTTTTPPTTTATATHT
jgi:ABC-type Fe3+-hydroxamate transport system substrate-binding protein